jgi:hypothetical protein
MKTFKQFNKKKNDDDDFVVLSDVIHFKSGVDGKHNADENFKPSVKKDKSHYVKEETKPAMFGDWLYKNENAHLGDNHEEVGNTLRHTDSPLYNYGGEFNPNETKEERDTRWVYQSHRDAIRQYTASSEKLNKALVRKNKKFFENDNWEQDRLDRLDATTDEHRANHDHTLYSGLTFDPRKKLKGKNKFISPAFISATHSKVIASNFTRPIKNDDAPEGLPALLKQHKTNHIMHINIPTGARVMNISSLSNHREEHESLIGRNSKFEYSHAEPKIDEFGNHYLIHHVNLVND